MAEQSETTTIPLESGSESSSTSLGLETTEKTASSVGVTTEDVVALKQERDELRRRNEQYLRERNGWEAQSRRNLEENRAVVERLARLEGRSEGQSGQTRTEETKYVKGKLKASMHKWLNNDDTELDEVETLLERALTHPTQTQSTLKPEDFKKLIREELVELGTKGNVQTIVGTRHPDLADTRSQLTQAVWDEYDAYVANPENTILYGKDERYHVPMRGPDGQQRMVDARYVDRLAADIKLRGGVQEGRRQEVRAAQVGGTQTGSGRTTQANTQRSVEALDLLSEAERALIADPKVRKGWPKMPAEPKAAAKYFWEGLLESEKSRRLAAYRDRMRGRG